MDTSFIDFHTHKPSQSEEVLSIVSYDIIKGINQSPTHYHTLGIHPWSIDDAYVLNYLRTLVERISETKLIAVGEIGLDKVNGPSLDLQKDVFEKQVRIAINHGKPIVIHCVKAWNELIDIKQKLPGSTSWAVHGFYGNRELAKQLIEKGFYISVGTALLKPNSKLVDALKGISLDKLFFETDASDIGIVDVYTRASQILRISIDELKGQIFENYINFFKPRLVIRSSAN
jgi:TatD DNase family protein